MVPVDIRKRAFQYALRAIRLFRHLRREKEWAGWIIGEQFLKSATSIGANIEEAQSAESRADFIHKMAIAQKESRESLYWLKLLAESELIAHAKLEPLLKETDEIIAVITRIIVNSKKGRGH
jgi:four helix bundle protein